MSGCSKAAKPFSRCLQRSKASKYGFNASRTFTNGCQRRAEVPAGDAATETAKYTPMYDPATVSTSKGERALMEQGVLPIGSRRRRAAIGSSDDLPFAQLPYQCFQEARKILQADREEKVKAINAERAKIDHLLKQDPSVVAGGEKMKQIRLDSMRRHIEDLKILADINDPMIKKRFEDGEGDMSKPIYRFLADRKWRSYQRRLTVQRVKQLSIVPDVLPFFDPTAEVRMAFRKRNVQPGEFIDSRVSEVPPRLNVQVFDKGERLVTIVVVDSDVPVVDKDNFTSRCHYLAANIPLDPTSTSLPLARVAPSTLALPWLPAFAQKGSPYHRYSIFVLQQQEDATIDVEALKGVERDRFSLRAFVQQQRLQPIGATMFRSLWDEGTADVMARNGIEGADIEFKRKKIMALKPKQKARGWEARHASDKYRSLRR